DLGMLVPIDKASRQAPEPASGLDVTQNQEHASLILDQRRDHHLGVSEKDPIATGTHAQRLVGNQPRRGPGPAIGAVRDHRERLRRHPAGSTAAATASLIASPMRNGKSPSPRTLEAGTNRASHSRPNT